MINYQKATKIINNVSLNLPNEKISISDSLNRVCAKNVLSPSINPLSNNTAFDGFAVLTKETKGLSKKKVKKFKIIKSKKVKITKDEAEEFYKVHQTKPFYNDLCNYLSSGPIVVMILEGEDAISKNREIMGATDPLKAEEGTIRRMYGISIDKNSVHGSDSSKNAKIEINFFFNK